MTFATNSTVGGSPLLGCRETPKALTPQVPGPEHTRRWVRRSLGPQPHGRQFLPGQGQAAPTPPPPPPHRNRAWGGAQGPKGRERPHGAAFGDRARLRQLVTSAGGVLEQRRADGPQACPAGGAAPTWVPFSPGGPSLPGWPCREREACVSRCPADLRLPRSGPAVWEGGPGHPPAPSRPHTEAGSTGSQAHGPRLQAASLAQAASRQAPAMAGVHCGGDRVCGSAGTA